MPLAHHLQLTRILLCVGLGAAINVVICLYIAFVSSDTLADDALSSWRTTYDAISDTTWSAARADVFGGTYVRMNRIGDGRVAGYRGAIAEDGPPPGVPNWSVTRNPAPHAQSEVRQIRERGYGWPLRTFSGYEAMKGDGPARAPIIREYHGFWPADNEPWTDRAGLYFRVPLFPIWPGLLFNTLLYSLCVWLLLFGWSRIKMHARTRRGLCAVCAYPLHESAICPECGTPR